MFWKTKAFRVSKRVCHLPFQIWRSKMRPALDTFLTNWALLEWPSTHVVIRKVRIWTKRKVLIPVNELLQNAWRNEDLITLSSWLKSVSLVLQHFVMRHMHNNSPSRSLKSCNVLYVMLSQGAGDVNVYMQFWSK